MARIKSRAALMLSGALSATIAPLLAQDKKLDLTKVLGDVNSRNMGKAPGKLAGKIVAATKGLLAQDAELDADDVVKVIAAINGTTAETTAEDDDIPDETAMDEGDDCPTCGQPKPIAKDGENEDGEGDDKDKDKDKPAMDAATVAKTVAKTVAELQTAHREVAPIIGEVKIACDSANDVYKLALDHAKVDLAGVHPSAYRAMVGMLAKAADAPTPPIALDRKTVGDDFRARFPGAGHLVAS